MRSLSSILFLLMTLVLPMAGVQRYFCTVDMAYVDGEAKCLVETKDCCKTEKHSPAKPECMVVAKLLPNAEKSSPLQVPVALVACVIPNSVVSLEPPVYNETGFSPEVLRGPPQRERLFLAFERLLI